MATCEKCGASFDPATASREVTTTRVLCAPCAAERAAEKARAKQKATVAVPAASAAPAPRPAPPAPAKIPAVVPPPRPAQSAPAPAVAPREAKRPPPTAPTLPPPAKKAPPAPPPRPARAHRDHELDKEELKKQKNKSVVIGYLVATLLTIVAGVVVWQVLSKKRDDQAAADAIKKTRDDFKNAFFGMDINSEETALAAAKFADEKRAIWEQDDEIATDTQSRLAKANSNAKLFKERRELNAQISTIETEFGAPANLTPQKVVDLRRQLDDIEPKVASSAETVARVSALRSSADKLYAERLVEDARSEASAPTRDTLIKFQRAEDEVRVLLEKAVKGKNQAMDELFRPLYQTVIKESDEAVAKVFTPDEIEKLPWRDLLADKERENWLAPAAKGFEWRLDSGVMHVIGPDSDAEGTPILSIGDTEKWCDFVGEMEFTLVKGEALLYFRLGLGSSATRDAIAPQKLSTEGSNALVAGESYKSNFALIGSAYEFGIAGYDPDTTPIGWTRIRKGALAFEFNPGAVKAELRITKLRIKVLRSAG